MYRSAARVGLARFDDAVSGSPTDFDAFAKYGASKSAVRGRACGFSAHAVTRHDAFYGEYAQTGVVLSLLNRGGASKAGSAELSRLGSLLELGFWRGTLVEVPLWWFSLSGEGSLEPL
ncbi:hypothetical protein KM043_005596 [Ampulex compressa]|nr:hypothetical protein KM043_005596 [Ampulex compressa]